MSPLSKQLFVYQLAPDQPTKKLNRPPQLALQPTGLSMFDQHMKGGMSLSELAVHTVFSVVIVVAGG